MGIIQIKVSALAKKQESFAYYRGIECAFFMLVGLELFGGTTN